MIAPAILILLAIAVVIAGLALVWLAEQYPWSEGAPRQSGILALRVVGWMMLLGGVLGGIAVATHAFSILLWIVTIVIFLTSMGRYYTAERQSLLWVLTVACEKGIPLAEAARAFAHERNDSIGRSALKLSDYLDAGVPLGVAVERSRIRLPAAARLAVEMGPETGDLGPALRQVVGQADDRDNVIRSFLAKLLYLSLIVFYAGALGTFLVLKILPVMQKMFSEFDLKLPAVTTLVIRATDSLFNPLLVGPLLIFWLVVTVTVLVAYARSTLPNVPGVRWLRAASDSSLVMRWLGLAVRQGRPISDVVRRLAVHFPVAQTRRRLELASQRIDRGADWNESLLAAQLIRPPESVLFRSAERVGNLAWALDEMSDSSLRRASYRLCGFLDLAFITVLLVFGVGTLGFALAVMAPLVSLIQGLS